MDDVLDRRFREIAEEALECAMSWEEDACVLGNITADDLSLVLHDYLDLLNSYPAEVRRLKAEGG